MRREISQAAPQSIGPSPAHFDELASKINVDFVKLAECRVASGWRLSLIGTDSPSIHYNVVGYGKLTLCDRVRISLRPHTLVILPKNSSFTLTLEEDCNISQSVSDEIASANSEKVRHFIAGYGEPKLILVCGYFSAHFGHSIRLFDELRKPIVEQFGERDRVSNKLFEILDELLSYEAGAGAMSAGLLKLVLIQLLRRSLVSNVTWMERFSVLRDPLISRAFADMVASPSAPHSVQSLAETAGLSRSAFMARFVSAFGAPPMSILRHLRMRHAADLLASNALSLDQIARLTGYGNRSSFSRAFSRAHGTDPDTFRRRRVE